MKRILFLVLILILPACEPDDICSESTQTTSPLVITFFNIENISNIKTVPGLFAVGLDSEGNEVVIDGEIVRNYKPIPLEVALSNDISFTKGCYTGQEIIARMDARGALSRTLVTFSSTELLDLGNHRVVGGGKLMVFDSLNNNGKTYNLGLIHPDIADEGVEFELDAIKCTILTKW